MPKKTKKVKKVIRKVGKKKKVDPKVKVTQTNRQIVNVIIADVKKKKRRAKKKLPPQNPVQQGIINDNVNRVFAEYMRASNIKAQTDQSLKLRELAADVKKLKMDERSAVLNQIEDQTKAIEEAKAPKQPKIEEISEEKAKKIKELRQIAMPHMAKLKEERAKLRKEIKLLERRKIMTTDSKAKLESLRSELSNVERWIEENPTQGLGKLVSAINRNGEEGRGLYDYEIEEIMKGIPNWIGVYPSDKVMDIIPKENMNLIANLDKSNEPGSHWVAIRFDNKSKSCEYYDSFGRDAPSNIDRAIKQHIDQLDLPNMWKYKINRVKTQDEDSKLCGYHSCLFLLCREIGQTFSEATDFNEEDVEKAIKYLKFKLI